MTQKLLIIGHVWPEPQSSAAGSRMMQLIESFQKEGYDILFASACAKSGNAFDLSALGIVQANIEMNHASFDHFVKSFNPDVVLFDRFMTEEQFGWRVTENCPDALKILDTEDLHCLRRGRQKAFKDGNLFDDTYLYSDVAKREVASIYRCDISLMISEVEMQILKEKFGVPEALLTYVPFQCDAILEQSVHELPSFHQRSDFISIGNFLHEPNYNGILYLKETIWPKIRARLRDAQLHIYGAYTPQKVLQLHDEAVGFLVKGFAKDVNKVMSDAKVCLAPLRFGAGLKGKLIDAMKNGTPCVMTSIAAEGMFGPLQPNGFIEDSVEAFAEKAVLLYQDAFTWKEKQRLGFEIINQRFDKILLHQQLFHNLNKTGQHLKQHRTNNFTGQMLHHHQLQSTKYLSKWIAEKNNTSILDIERKSEKNPPHM